MSEMSASDVEAMRQRHEDERAGWYSDLEEVRQRLAATTEENRWLRMQLLELNARAPSPETSTAPTPFARPRRTVRVRRTHTDLPTLRR